MSLHKATNQGNTKEFFVDIDKQHTFLMEINKREDGDFFLFCRPVNNSTNFFFMGRDEKGSWTILSRFTAPTYILALESLISEKVTQVMATRTSL